MATCLTEIDGSVLEGGGQILRNSAAFSAILQQPVHIFKIRASRDNPGLRAQHLSGLQVIKDLSNGYLENGSIGSTDVKLVPNRLNGGCFLADTKTAGSVCLLIQAALPCMLFARKRTELILRGGTNAAMAPPIDYFIMVLKPMLERIGLQFDCQLKRRGFYPKGGGEVSVSVEPVKKLKCFEFVDPLGQFTRITGLSLTAGMLPIKVAKVMADCATRLVRSHFPDIPIDIQVIKETEDRAFATGSSIILVAETSTGFRIAASALGSKDKRAEKVGEEAGQSLVYNMESGGCMDEHLQDQLIIFMALAEGESRIKCGKVTLHTETAIHVAQLMTKAEFRIEQLSNSTNLIHCIGIGHQNDAI